ncbi:hypothetical protein [Reinekea blandensis]|uniref:Uncharacterized protein n=1 Tax=Reinekea blandensis MED297 TaxID=314283 RepID=A4BJX7_9GAMM|nr:hypothetical protein [Reinekea blandensis]EAR07578.1 hypothetical protein MED297_00115 [Reinekea sp. MED297] [Reinekea blandensis MED297]
METTSVNNGGANNPSLTLHQRVAMQGVFGWVAAFVMLVILLVNNFMLAREDKEVLAVDPATNRVIGSVIFDEARVRSVSQINKDLKGWLSAYNSLNAETVWEDAQIAINHMEDSLAEATFKRWTELSQEQKEKGQAMPYLQQIEASGNVARVVFNDEESTLRRDDRVPTLFYGEIQFDIISGIVNPTKRTLRQSIKFNLVPRSENNSLGMEVIDVQDI